MNKQEFLNKLYLEGKIQKTEPNDNLKTAYLLRAKESLSSAKALFKIENLNDSIALAYYSMYHSVLALLFKAGIKCENHSGAIILLEKVFHINTDELKKAKSERIDKQYYAETKITKEDALQAIKSAEEFINEMTNFIEILNNQKIREFQTAAFKMIK